MIERPAGTRMLSRIGGSLCLRRFYARSYLAELDRALDVAPAEPTSDYKPR